MSAPALPRPVLQARAQELVRLGFYEEEALVLASDADIDMDEVRKLVRAGTPLELICRTGL